jgi:hypothetical protein
VGIGDRARAQSPTRHPVDPLLHLKGGEFRCSSIAEVSVDLTIPVHLIRLACVWLPLPGRPRHVFGDHLFNRQARLGFVSTRLAVDPNLSQGLNPVQAGVATLGALIPALNSYVEHVLASWFSSKDAIVSVKDAFANFFGGNLNEGFTHLRDVTQSAFAIHEGAIAIPTLLRDVFDAVPCGILVGLIQSGTSAAFSFLASIGGRVWGWITGAIDSVDWIGVGSRILGWIGSAIGGMVSLSSELVTNGYELILSFYDGLAQRWPAIPSWLAGIAVMVISDLYLFLMGNGLDLVGGLWEGVQRQWDIISLWFATVGSLAAGAVSIFYDTLRKKGTPILAGSTSASPTTGMTRCCRGSRTINWDSIGNTLMTRFQGAIATAFALRDLGAGDVLSVRASILNWLTDPINGI